MNEPMSMPEPAPSQQPGPSLPIFPAESGTCRGAVAELVPEPGPQVPQRMLDECDLRSPRIRRRVVLPALLFVAACVTTFAAGVYGWQIAILDDRFLELARANWRQGVEYMVAVMAMLLAHEMGHFLMTVRYRVPASYPIFLPIPMMLTGTMGAVIGHGWTQGGSKAIVRHRHRGPAGWTRADRAADLRSAFGPPSRCRRMCPTTAPRW